MGSIIYTNVRSKVSKKKQAAREALLKEQRAAKADLKKMKAGTKFSVNYRESSNHIPSVGTGIGTAVKQEQKQYTGDVIIGISQMHKSNAVPVINQEAAQDIARMRR